jgi:NAD(P)-dependent dehydrogenase (short-subunit alcohol dehydrogenase family)
LATSLLDDLIPKEHYSTQFAKLETSIFDIPPYYERIHPGKRKMFNLKGKVAVITGAGSGLGEATAKMMARLGAKIIVGDIVLGNAEKVATEISNSGGAATATYFDLHDAASIAAMMTKAATVYGRLDILHANAADIAPEVATKDINITDIPVEAWDRVFHGNARGTMLCCKYAIPHMLANGGGAIVCTGSAMSLRGNLGGIAYSSSKFTILQIARSVATSHGKRGIRANVVLPGLTMTDYVKTHMPNALADVMLAETLSDRLGHPDDIAHAVTFLSSDAARHINGQYLVVDGGESIHASNIDVTP